MRSVVSLSEGGQSSRRSDELSSICASSDIVEMLIAGDAGAGVCTGGLSEGCYAV